MPDYIVNKLRDCTCVPHGEICREAADEIERLRRRLLAEENAYDIERRQNEHLQTDRNNLELEVERLRKERDELRREVCEYATTGETIGAALLYANSRGWDCFKEEEHGKTTMG